MQGMFQLDRNMHGLSLFFWLLFVANGEKGRYAQIWERDNAVLHFTRFNYSSKKGANPGPQVIHAFENNSTDKLCTQSSFYCIWELAHMAHTSRTLSNDKSTTQSLAHPRLIAE